MTKLILRRILFFIPVLFVTVTIVFFLVRLTPGGPFDGEKVFPESVKKRIEEKYLLNAPLHKQYFHYLWGLCRGDLGVSLNKPMRSVTEWIMLRFPVSLELGFYSLLVALGFGLCAGLLAASRPNSSRDYIPMSLAMAGICIPRFVLGPLLVLIFGIWLEVLPVEGWYGPSHRVLPSLTMGAVYAAYIARLCRGGMLEVMAQDFIRTARSKGMSEARVVLRHALRGGIQPVVTFMGPAAAGLLAGSFVVETIFRVPGLGREFIQAAINRDYTMVLGTVLFFAFLILLFNLIADIAQAWLDPRVRRM